MEVLYLGSEYRMRRIISSISVQDQNKAAPAIFRMQIEQIRTLLGQPQISLKTKWEIGTPFEYHLNKLNACYKFKKDFKKFKFQAPDTLTKSIKTIPL